VELSITSAAGEPQEHVLLQVEILDGAGVSSGGIVIRYDTATLILEQAILTNLGRQRFAIREDGLSVLPGEIRVGFFTSKLPVVADGVLLELTFAIAAGATFGETDLTLEASGFADATFNPLEPTLLNGQVDVLQPIPPPSASFLSDIAEGDAPLEVQFTDISTGQIDRRTWTFDAGETSQLENPIHIFQERGVYQITLSVSGPGGTDTATADIRVNQSMPVPLAAAGDGTASFDFDLSEGDQQKLELKDVTPGQSVAVQLIL
jgi:hypothetical protein